MEAVYEEEKGMSVGRCIKCDFCEVSKRQSYGTFKKEITLTCEVTGQRLKVEQCHWFY